MEYTKTLQALETKRFDLQVKFEDKMFTAQVEHLNQSEEAYQKIYKIQQRIQQDQREFQDKQMELQKAQIGIQAALLKAQKEQNDNARIANNSLRDFGSNLKWISTYGPGAAGALSRVMKEIQAILRLGLGH